MVNPTELAVNDIVSFYLHNDTLRYYVRLVSPKQRRGIAVFHLNKKGRPQYVRVPGYAIPADVECGLVLRRNISAQIEDLLFK